MVHKGSEHVTYKNCTLTRAKITVPSGVVVSGVVVEFSSGRRTICQDEEIAKRYIDHVKELANEVQSRR